ncbi:MAG: glycosyltransferase family 4 protein [Candidatus Bathyarchaeia archaeon]
MKILFMTSRDITHPKWAGGDVYHFEIAKRLAQSGHKVTMLCSRYSGCKNYEKLHGIQIIRIRGGIFRILSNFLFYYKSLIGRYDVVIEEAEGPAGPFFAFLYVKEPIVIMWHQLGKLIYFNQFPYPIALALLLLEKVYVSLTRKKHNIIVPSRERAKEFLEVGFPIYKVHIVPAAANTVTSVPSKNVRSEFARGKEPYFLVLGKIRKYKAYHHAIEALKKLRDDDETCFLIIAGRRGEDRYYAELQKLIADYKLQDHVSIRLDISEEEKVQLLSSAIALIVTSPVEGFSIVSVEANMLGTPVIATEGVPEDVVKNGYNGLKYKFGDIRALAENMRRIIADTELRRQLSANAFEHATRFSWDTSAKIFKEVLENVKRSYVN